MKLSEIQFTPQETGFLASQTYYYNDISRHNDTYGKVVNFYEEDEDQDLNHIDLQRLCNYISHEIVYNQYGPSCQRYCLEKLKSALKKEEAQVSQYQFSNVECHFSALGNLLGSIKDKENEKRRLVYRLEANVKTNDGQFAKKELLLQIDRKMFDEIFDAVSEAQITYDIADLDVDFSATITFYCEVLQGTANHLPIYVPHDYFSDIAEI